MIVCHGVAILERFPFPPPGLMDNRIQRAPRHGIEQVKTRPAADGIRRYVLPHSEQDTSLPVDCELILQSIEQNRDLLACQSGRLYFRPQFVQSSSRSGLLNAVPLLARPA